MYRKLEVIVLTAAITLFVLYWKNEEKQNNQFSAQGMVYGEEKFIFSPGEYLTEGKSKQEEMIKEPEEILQDSEKVIQSLMEYDFSLNVNPIDREKHTKDEEAIYQRAFYETVTNQVPLYYPGEVTDEGEPSDTAFYFREKTMFSELTGRGFEIAMEGAEYYYMDFTNDGLPELVIVFNGIVEGMEVLQYIPETKRVEAKNILSLGSYVGTGQVLWYNDRRYVYRRYSMNPDVLEREIICLQNNVGGYYELSGYTYTLGEFDVRLNTDEKGEMLKERMLAERENGAQPQSFEEIFGEMSVYTAEKMEGEGAIKAYEAFLAGRKEAKGISMKEILEKESNLRYLIWDVTGDGIPELHLKTNATYYIYKYERNVLFLWNYWPVHVWRDRKFEFWVLEDGRSFQLYGDTRVDGYADSYYCEEINEIGELIHSDYFSISRFYSMDEKNYYEFIINGEQVTMEEWIRKAEEYLYLEEDGTVRVKNCVEWKELTIWKNKSR